MRTATIQIHPDSLAHNLELIKRTAKNAHVLAMVKADAYGHGVAQVVPALMAADGFGVACMAEALAVKKALTAPRPIVLIEGVFSLEEWHTACQENFMCVIHHTEQLDYALAHPPKPDSDTATLWLKYNTGMNRLGFTKEAAESACHALIDAGYKVILTSHFACADSQDHPLNTAQITAFNALLSTLKTRHGEAVKGSLCNSAGIFHFKECHHDWVRAGIALYGSNPISTGTANALGLRPAMTLSAKIMALHTLKKGESVGYGGLWVAPNDCTIAITSLGYGDGYPRVVKDAYVSLHGQRVPIIGRVAMDMIAIDTQELPVKLGDDVVFWGVSPTVDETAAAAQTLGYELFCRLTNRPTRQLTPLLQG